MKHCLPSEGVFAVKTFQKSDKWKTYSSKPKRSQICELVGPTISCTSTRRNGDITAQVWFENFGVPSERHLDDRRIRDDVEKKSLFTNSQTGILAPRWRDTQLAKMLYRHLFKSVRLMTACNIGRVQIGKHCSFILVRIIGVAVEIAQNEIVLKLPAHN